MNRMKRSLFLVILGICVLFVTLTIRPSLSENSTFGEIRGVWLTNIDSDVLFSPKQTEKAIADLTKLNFNILYPTVWNWGHTLYPSKIAELHTGKLVDPTEGLQDRDLLQEIVDQGHQQKMTVIPWFEFGFMAPVDSDLAKTHPDWLTQKPDGETVWLEGKTHERVWLNPLNPAVQQFISDLVLEIVNQYDIDGIQFDDHFGYPADFGYDPLTLKLYQAEHSGKLPPNPTVLKPVEDCVVNDPEWQAWVDWRSQKITDYMAKLSKQIKAVKPQILVSISPNPQRFSKNCFLMDWQSWQKKGLMDQLVLQVYRNQLSDFQRELQKPEVQIAKQEIPVAIGILSGLKNRPLPMTQIQEQVNFVRDEKFAGVSFFFYESLWNLGKESPEDRQNQWKTLFSE